jgi:FdhD protein
MGSGESTSSSLDSGEAVGTDVLRWNPERGLVRGTDTLVREEPLEIRIQGRCVSITMRTPGCDEELVAGFFLSEGLIRYRQDIIDIAHCRQAESESQPNVVNVFLAPSVEVDFERLTRHVYASSSCGICGKASIESIHQQFAPLSSCVRLDPGLLVDLPERLRDNQRTFHQTGGLHAAWVFSLGGDLLVAREDVGRHNAVDKAVGFGLLNGLVPLDAHVLLVSGRASFEIMQKALAARIPIVAAISAPSSLAVEFARESGQILVGFLRGQSMNIYAGAERITDGRPAR